MKQKTMRALLCLMTLAAALWLLPVGAAAATSILNGGYPYGYDMSENSVTLAVDVESDSATIKYQWQRANKKEDFINDNASGITNLSEGRTITLDMTSTSSGLWYRCSVNDGIAASEPVQIVKASRGVGSENNRIWTNTRSNSDSSSNTEETNWFITNGEMAYWVNKDQFNVMGSYVHEGTYYMLQTSYKGYWEIYSGSDALEHLKLSFSDNSRGILFDAKLGTGNNMYIKADTQLGDYPLLGEAADKAVLKAQLGDGDRLDRITLMGVKDFSQANGDTPALAITPDVSTPSSSFWIGQYNKSEGYKFNTKTKSEEGNQYSTKTVGTQENVVTLVQNTDTEMTLSWQGVTDGIVKFKFGVGTINELGMVQCSVNYVEEKLTGLLLNTEYRIEVRGKTALPKYSIVADGNGKISLAGTDKNGHAYSFFGEHLEIGRTNSTDTTKEIVIPVRPTAVSPTNITATQSEVSFTSASGQIYEYFVNNGDWKQLSVGADGKCTISGLLPGDTVEIKTRKVATDSSFASEWTAPAKITTLREITVSGIAAQNKTYNGTKDVVLDYSGVSLSGKMDEDDLSVTANGEFDSADAGNNKTVTISGLTLTGSASGNYVLATTGQQTAATASIAACEVTVTITPNGGVYGDTITPASAVLAGTVAGESVPVTLTYQSAAGYDSATPPTEAGTYTVTASINDSNYVLTGTTTAAFVVAQSGTEFEALSVNGAGTSAEIAYGEPVTVTAKPKATGQAASSALYGLLRRSVPTQRQMALFIGDQQISDPVYADATSGVYTMTLDTKKKMLAVGVNSVDVRYTGDTNMANAAGRVTITLLKKPLTITGVTAEERTYDPASRTVRITGATLAGKALETDDVALDLTGLVGTLAGEGAGEYDELILPDALSLTGEHAAYYTVDGGGVRAAVRIGRAPLDLRVRIADWTVGDAPAEPTITGNSGGGEVRYAYKPRSAGDSEYSAEVPALAGSYTVRASVAQTANYLGAEATADFSILPKPAAMPETGDGSRLSLWLALCLLAGAGTLALLRRRAEP